MAAGILATVVLGTILYVATDTGTLKIEGYKPDVTVLVDDRAITIANVEEPTAAVRRGRHTLRIMRGDARVAAPVSFEVERGEQFLVRIAPGKGADWDEEPGMKKDHGAEVKEPEEDASKKGALGTAKPAPEPDKPPPDKPVEPPSTVTGGDTERDAKPIASKEVFSRATGMKLARIEPGTFPMGSTKEQIDQVVMLPGSASRFFWNDEQPQHPVRITKPFYIGVHEVTVGQFRRFVDDAKFRTEAERDGKGGYGVDEAVGTIRQDPKYTWRDPGFPQTDEQPVVNVSWNDAVAFCEWLSSQDDCKYRLPTEAEWEYACRAGSATLFPNGNAPEGLALVGNIADGTAKENFPVGDAIKAKDGHVFTAPVGSFAANRWGLRDMIGNVSEWCSDRYESEYYKTSPSDDPPGAAGAAARVFRGGCWDDPPVNARSARRSGNAPGHRGNDLGFRVARVQSE